MTITEVADGVHRIEYAATNCYFIDDPNGPVFVDAGLPRSWAEADQILGNLGYAWAEVAAVVLTHAHFDHLGFAARVHAAGVDVWVHEADVPIATSPYQYRPGRWRLRYPLLYPRSWPYLAAMVGAGALNVAGVDSVRAFQDGQELPGGLQVVATPGHTDGHCALHLASRDVVFSGDGLVTLDPYTGKEGARIVAQAGTKDAETAVQSLEALAQTGAGTVLPGHGDPWVHGVDAAVQLATAAGSA